MKNLLWIYRSTTGIIAVEENEQVRHHNPFAHLFLRSPLKCWRLSSCRDTSFECCWLDGILPVESHLMLRQVILLPRLVLFISIPASFLFFLSLVFSCLLHLVRTQDQLNQTWSVQERYCGGLLGVWPLYCRCHIFVCSWGFCCVLRQAGTLEVDSRWRGCVITLVLLSNCAVVCYFLTTISNHCYFRLLKWFTDKFGVCVCVCFGGVFCACSSQKLEQQEELEAGKAVHYTWAEPTGSRELSWKCGSYSGKLKSEEVLCLSQASIEKTKATSASLYRFMFIALKWY